MAIEKYVQTGMEIVEHFDSSIKTANWQPEVYVPPEILEFVHNLQPDPKFAYVHTIAMSDGDSYGSNLNGDIFTAEELTGVQTGQEAMKNPGASRGVCKPRYKTFEDARFFRHHDNRETSPFYGDVPLAAWNDQMRRVELIIRIAREDIPELGMRGAPDIILKLDRRGHISVSMGTRIAYEKCSYCGATNEFVSQRCPHLKHMMHRIMPNGVKVAAINFGTRYFDISDVTVPADPVANSLAKVASAGTGLVAAGNLARDVVAEKLSRWLQKRSEMEKNVPCDPLSGCAESPADVPEKGIEPISAEEITRAVKAAGADLDSIIATTTLSGMLLSPEELIAFTCACQPEAKTAERPEDFDGFGGVSLDKFSLRVYDALRQKIASRSGFVVAHPTAEWEPAKIAEQGCTVAAVYYDFYRSTIGTLSRSSFTKAAHAIPAVRELHGGNPGQLRAGIGCLVHGGRSSSL